MKKYPLYLLIMLFLIISCNLDNGKGDVSLDRSFRKVEINDEYELYIPKSMSSTSSLNDEASLQYQNVFKEMYTIIIDEPADTIMNIMKEIGVYEDSLSQVENYRNVQLNLTLEYIDDMVKESFNSFERGNLNFATAEATMFAKEVEDEIKYYLTFVEGRDKLYMIMSWTLADLETKNDPYLKKIGETFRLIN